MKKKLALVHENTVPLEDLNNTELVLLAEDIGVFAAHRDMNKDELLRLIRTAEYEDTTLLGARPVHVWRLQIMKHIRSVWDQVAPTIQGCPARTGSPTACFTCTDHQVACCIEQNAHLVNTPLEEEEMANASNVTAKTRAELTAWSESTDPAERSKLGKQLIALGESPASVTKLSAAQRVDRALELQKEAGLTAGEEEKPKAAKGAAAPKAAASTPKTAASTAGSAKDGGGLGNEGAALLKEILAKLNSLEENVNNLGQQVAEQDPYIKEAHAAARYAATLGLGASDEDVAGLLGTLMVEPEEEGND